MRRRNFIGKTLAASALLGAGSFPIEAIAADEMLKLTILHTNDTHSRIEPFPADSKYPNMGGVAGRSSLVKKVRSEEKNVLLFDSGDIFQGTPYFNYFRGKPEMEVMSMIGYDAVTIGNHDFDGGLDDLAEQLQHASFQMLTCNYDFTDTVMEGKTKPYEIFESNGIKTGVFGLGIELEGLVPSKLFGKTKYKDPVKAANKTAATLSREYDCDFVVCLSHLGYDYGTPKVSDVVLAQESENIDLILGGHTHTFFEKPVTMMNKKHRPVVINQVGWAGIVVGKIDVVFDYSRKRKKVFSDTVKVF